MLSTLVNKRRALLALGYHPYIALRNEELRVVSKALKRKIQTSQDHKYKLRKVTANIYGCLLKKRNCA